MDQSVLPVSVDDEDPLTFLMERSAEVHRDCAFPDPTLLLSYRDDFCCQSSPLFLDADGFYLDEFVFQSVLSLTCDALAIRPRFMRIKRPVDWRVGGGSESQQE